MHTYPKVAHSQDIPISMPEDTQARGTLRGPGLDNTENNLPAVVWCGSGADSWPCELTFSHLSTFLLHQGLSEPTAAGMGHVEQCCWCVIVFPAISIESVFCFRWVDDVQVEEEEERYE